MAYANAGIFGEAPVATVGAPVVEANSAHVLSKSVVNTYTSHPAPLSVSPLSYAAPISAPVPVISSYSGPLRTKSVAPLSFVAPAPVFSSYSAPLVAKSVASFPIAAPGPVISAYSAPLVAKSVAPLSFIAPAPVFSAYSTALVAKSVAPFPIAAPGPVVSAYSPAPLVQPW